MSNKTRILFVCIHNSARSQMAEAFVNNYSNGEFEAESAGIEPGKLNPVVVKAMKELDVDISTNATNSVQSFIEQEKVFDYLVTVCDETSAERCPLYPGAGKRVHMGFEDPSALNGTDEEKLQNTRIIRDQIKTTITQWLEELS